MICLCSPESPNGPASLNNSVYKGNWRMLESILVSQFPHYRHYFVARRGAEVPGHLSNINKIACNAFVQIKCDAGTMKQQTRLYVRFTTRKLKFG